MTETFDVIMCAYASVGKDLERRLKDVRYIGRRPPARPQGGRIP